MDAGAAGRYHGALVRTLVSVPWLVVAILAGGCGASAATCVPGASAACACAGVATPGAQTCSPDGTFGPCDCAGPPPPAAAAEPVATPPGSTVGGDLAEGCVSDPAADAARRADANPADATVVVQDLEFEDDHRHGEEVCVTFPDWGGSESVTYWTYGPAGASCLRYLGEVEDRRGDRDVPGM